MRAAVMAAAIVLMVAGQGAKADGDATAGAVVFKKCAICHSPEKGVNKIGPSLWGVVGRKSASIPDFNYSDAMKAADKTWDPPTLDAYITDPRGYIPGVKMIFPGLKDQTDRQNVIAYLETLK